METRLYIHFNLIVNNVLTNTQYPICMKKDEFDQFYKVLFKGSRGKCIRTYSQFPPAQFYK
ncbi:hypothetical protein [Desulfofalx alkaliphila]|uniref:hypothetical protein n=1 Tax=Desulfofalx alkaliphila TaxID=105483 RepID=UPI001EE42F95|nr:hypothetical protein [Desulfofalx alkaliphila]